MIPKIIHFCWISGEPYPEQIAKCIQSWKEYLPDYQFVLWDQNKVSTLDSTWLNQTIKVKKYAFAADYIRIYALHHYGGIYLDADVELIGTLNPFLGHDFFIGVEYNNDLEPAVFGAIAGHPWLTDLLDYYKNRSFIKSDGTLDIRPLPSIFNETAIKRYGFRTNGKMQFINSEHIAIYPSDFFSPRNIYFKQIKRTSHTVAIHHFFGSWFPRDVKYKLNRIIHQAIYRLCGKSFHNLIIQIIRKIS